MRGPRNIGPIVDSVRGQFGPIAISLMLVATITAGLEVLTSILDPVRVPVVYLLPVLSAATRWGRIPGVIAAFAGAASAAFFFYPPKYSFHIADEEQVISLFLFTVVALVSSQLAGNV